MSDFPTLELGELGEQIDAQLQDSGDLGDEEPDAPVEEAAESAPTEDSPVETNESAGEEPPAADAGDDFEARFAERFERDYAERSRGDIAKLRSGLDRRISAQRNEIEDLKEDLSVAEVGFDRALQALAEYDPQVAEDLKALRGRVSEKAAANRKVARLERQQAAETRRRYYAQVFGSELDPEDPELLEAFEAGDTRLEKVLMRERVGQLGLVFDGELGRFAKPAPSAAAIAPQAPTGPARDPATGQFVKQEDPQPTAAAAKARATREREQQRGSQPLSSGTAVRQKPERDLNKAAQNFQRQLEAMIAAAR